MAQFIKKRKAMIKKYRLFQLNLKQKALISKKKRSILN